MYLIFLMVVMMGIWNFCEGVAASILTGPSTQYQQSQFLFRESWYKREKQRFLSQKS